MALLLGIDLGTSYFKVGVFDLQGGLRGLGRVAVPKSAPAPGWSELPVPEFWATLRQAVNSAFADAGATPGEISAVSYSSQASTFLLLDAHDEPLTPLVVWTDLRGAPVPEDLAAFSRSERFRRTIGFEGFSDQSAPVKWRWFAREAPTVWERARRVLSLSDYLTLELTGERAGDASTAAFLGIYDLGGASWWAPALEFAGVTASQLARPLPPGAACGRTTKHATALLGLPAGIPFAVGALDHHAAAIGSGLGRLAELSLSTGTVLAALALVDEPCPEPGCYHGPHTDGRRFWRLTFDPNGAGQLEDYRRLHAPGHSLEELLALAAAAPTGIAWQPTTGGGHGEAVRAILERISARHAGLVAQVTGGGDRLDRTVDKVIATGGGARSPLWLQITADILNLPVVIPASPERACLGAAMFGAVAAGHYPDLAAAADRMVRLERVYVPDPAAVSHYQSRIPTRSPSNQIPTGK